MSSAARQGRLFLLITLIIVVAGEAVSLAIRYKLERLGLSDVARLCFTLGLFWNMWDGSRGARWLLVLCFVGAAGYGSYLLMTDPRVAAKPIGLLVVIPMIILALVLAIGLASPMVGAFQAHQREKEKANE
jgi:hypothetical protein